MRFFLLLTVLGGSVGIYVHQDRPDLWNQIASVGTATLRNTVVAEHSDIQNSPSEVRYYYTPPALPSHLVTASVPSPSSAAVAMPHHEFVAPSPIPAREHWNWTTTDGKTYDDVKIQKVEADCVTVLDQDGGARIDIATLPADIQQQLNYDPSLSVAASKERMKEDSYSVAALAQERIEGVKINQEKLAELDVASPAAPSPEATATSSPSDSETGVVVTDDSFSVYQADLGYVTRYIHINRATGLPEGDPYYVHRYEEDRRCIESYERAGNQHFVEGGQSYSSPGYRPAAGWAPGPQNNQLQSYQQRLVQAGSRPFASVLPRVPAQAPSSSSSHY